MVDRIAVGPTSLDMPAWIQATGVIVAILFSIWQARRDGRIRHRETTENFEREEEAKKEKLTKRYRFLAFADEEVRFAISHLSFFKQQFEASKIYSHEAGSDPSVLLAELLTEIDAEMERLERIAALPLEHWTEPQIAFLFFRGLQGTRRFAKQIHVSATRGNNAEENIDWFRYRAALSSAASLSNYMEVSFRLFKNTVAEHLIEADHQLVPIDHHQFDRAAEKIRRASPTFFEYTEADREDLEAEYDRQEIEQAKWEADQAGKKDQRPPADHASE